LENPIKTVLKSRLPKGTALFHLCTEIATNIDRTRQGVEKLIGKTPTHPDSKAGEIYFKLFEYLEIPLGDRQQHLQDLRMYISLTKTILSNANDSEFSAFLIEKMSRETCNIYCSIVDKTFHDEMEEILYLCTLLTVGIKSFLNRSYPNPAFAKMDIAIVKLFKELNIDIDLFSEFIGVLTEEESKWECNFNDEAEIIRNKIRRTRNREEEFLKIADALIAEIEFTATYEVSIKSFSDNIVFSEFNSGILRAFRLSEEKRCNSNAEFLAQSEFLTLLLEVNRVLLADPNFAPFLKKCISSDGEGLLSVAMQASEFPEAVPMLRQVIEWGHRMKVASKGKTGKKKA
jgi:hypothetical protein